MKKMNLLFKMLFILSSGILLFSCKSTQYTSKNIELTEADKGFLNQEIERMLEADQKYRNPLSLGTLDKKIIADDKEKSATLELEEYMVYRQSLDIEGFSKEVKDSLWRLQHEIDYNNYLKIKSLIKEYGYLSKERLGQKENRFFVMLLHPAPQLDPKTYRDELAAIFANEVKYKRMDPLQYAMFYDNITYKIMHEPMLYGTGKVFNHKTKTLTPPFIKDVKISNKARKAIGLPLLEEGDYQIAQK